MCGSKVSKVVKKAMGVSEKKESSQGGQAPVTAAKVDTRENERAQALADEQARNEQGSASTIITGKSTTIEPVEPEKKTLLG